MSLDLPISGLPVDSSKLQSTDLIPVVDNSGITKKIQAGTAGIVNTNTALTTANFEGLPAGSSVFGDTPTDTLNKILFAYQSPSFTYFDISGSSVIECGDKMAGEQIFEWGLSHIENVNANSVNIYDISNSLTLIENHAITGGASYNFDDYPSSGLQYDIPTVNVWRITAANTNNGTFIKDYGKSWQLRSYAGSNANTTLTNAQVLALSYHNLSESFPETIVFSGAGYFQYFIPSDFVQPTSFIDLNTGYPMGVVLIGVQTITNSFGVETSYNQYRSSFSLTDGTTVKIS